MSHRFVKIDLAASALGPVTADRDRATEVVVSNGKVSSAITLATGVARPSPGGHALARRDPSASLEGLVERGRESDEGPVSDLFDARSGALVASIDGGVFDAARAGDLVLASVFVPGPRTDVVAVVLGRGAPALRLPGSYRCVLAASTAFAIAASIGVAHAFRLVNGLVESVSFALPGGRPDARVVGGDALILVNGAILVVALDELPFRAGHQAIPITFTRTTGTGRGLAKPGVVIATVGAKIIVDHPDVKRITIERTMQDPPVKAGDLLRIDDVREPLPGILKVHAWSHEGGAASARVEAAPLTLPAPLVTPLDPAGTRARPMTENAKALAEWEARWSFRAPESLRQFLIETDGDPVLRRWLSKLGLEHLDVRDLSTDWQADPCLLMFAATGTGDAFALYLYPPALATEEPLVVRYLHEENGVELLANTMDGFLARLLAESEPDAPDVVHRVRARLGITTREAPPPAPPAWFPSARGPIVSLEDVRALESAGRHLEAERAYLAMYLRGRQRIDGREGLRRVYAALGWRGPADSLERSVG